MQREHAKDRTRTRAPASDNWERELVAVSRLRKGCLSVLRGNSGNAAGTLQNNVRLK